LAGRERQLVADNWRPPKQREQRSVCSLYTIHQTLAITIVQVGISSAEIFISNQVYLNNKQKLTLITYFNAEEKHYCLVTGLYTGKSGSRSRECRKDTE